MEIPQDPLATTISHLNLAQNQAEKIAGRWLLGEFFAES